MPFDNPGFETDGAFTGLPDGWTATPTATGESKFLFSPSPFEAFEAFEREWTSNETYTFAYADPIDLLEIFPAIFDSSLPDPEGVEDYEEGWSTNQNYLFVMASQVAAVFDSVDVETFEVWPSPATPPFTWDDVIAGLGEDVAEFDVAADDFEDFEEEWNNNPYANEWADVTAGAAVFDTGVGGASESVEDFEEVNPLQTIVVTPATNVISRTGHGLSANQLVTFENEGGTLPGGIQPETVYYVLALSSVAFKISATLAGPEVDITDTGTGTHKVRPDVATFWTTQMATL